MTDGGDRVLHAAVEVARDVLGDRLEAAFAIGSLAHGGFAPLVSDVDLALVLDRVDAGTASSIATVRDRTIARSPSDLAERLSIFWSDPRGVRDGPGEHDRLPAIDRLDLLDSGVLLFGTDSREPAHRPTAAELVREGAEFACEKFDDAYLARLRRADLLVREGPRPVTKAVLFPIRFLYTLATGRIGRNDDAAAWYADHGAHPALAREATRWRTAGIDDGSAAAELLRQHLVGVHVEFFRRYAAEMADGGLPQLVETLRMRERALAPADPAA
ncbi:hypothetical protein EV378_0050 [Pseudonocardia endophytica]|uniref:Nucleotidyltransferase-like protein n=1 Tax=Pseudonocardia endophytica TaxID=401976 RepID=A0A4R1HQ94_PSEEN|nr:hypothetical protein EV378_0050 [Pseudonocardia endophytica]